MSSNRRLSTRHSVEISASVSLGDDSFEGTLENLSLGGAYLLVDRRLPMGARVELSFRIPTHEQPIVTGASVRWSSETAAGLQFDGLRAREVWSLNKYFENLR
ncbi:MAG TPA: PilZ domain-containing protein [Kofleriaceae bacterium]|nr:PilZ domain-containing protein [Kofleriaceae bacterium]